VRLHETNIARMLERRRWSRKVNKRRALEANATLLALYLTKVQHILMDRLVFLDESASDERTGYRKRGWSPIGVDCRDLQSTRWHTRWSILPTLTIGGYLPNPLILQASVNQATFNWFVANRVLPHLDPGMVIVLDNASIHHDPELKALIEAAGCELIYLPPYSPDLSPIEQTFNALKAWIRRYIAIAGEFSDFGAFLAYAVQEAIGDVEEHYRESGYR
jgi:hypothetical protein